MFKFGFKFKHLIYGSFFFLLACNDAAREASQIRVFSIDISVTGLEEGESVQITETKSGRSKTITTNSRSTLPNFNLGVPFSIEVTENPINKRCTISNSNTTGLIDGASDNVNITCLKVFSIGGNITGLESDSLVLRLNAEDDLPIDKTDNFTFSTPLVDGSAYTVIVVTRPNTPSQICTVTNGSGTVSGTNVSNVAVVCVKDAPTASDVSITDENGGNAVVGDDLTGHYFYNDVDDDLEGISTFRWLRNGQVISGAALSTYTLIAVDVPTQITFEVTPIAVTGETIGSAITSSALATGTAPVVSGFARYLDINSNGVNDANDQLIIPFDQDVITNAMSSTDFDLPVTGDSFGTGATVIAGPASNEVTIILGNSPHFKTRQDFSNAATTTNSPSGIHVAALVMEGVIEGASGIDAVPSVPIDLIPAYVDSLQSLGSNDSTSIALGDLNGDGDLDMVVANGFGEVANGVYTNDGGTGSYIDSGQALGANNSQSVALGDLDGDGDLDMVMANASKSNRIYINNDGLGNFTGSDFVVNQGNTSVALGDVDGDGDLDIVLASTKGGANRVYINNGAGPNRFTDSGQALGAKSSLSIALGDVDGDGDLDMAVANYGQGFSSGSSNRLYTNDGAGGFTDSGQVLGLKNSTAIALGDVDGDGDLDMVVANSTGQGNRIYFNDGGSFTDSGQALGNHSSQSIALGDVDGDGDLDLVVANLSVQPNRVYINDGAGSFVDSGQTLGTNASFSIKLGDVDGDGDLDMVVGNGSFRNTVNRVYLNSLSGTE